MAKSNPSSDPNEPRADVNEPRADVLPTAWPADLAPKIIRFEELARCGEEIWIEHNRQLYRLRRTRQGKLILTK